MKPRPQVEVVNSLELLGAFSAQCIHDITNPLAVLVGNLQLADSLAGDSPPLVSILDKMRQAATDIGRVLDQMSQLSRQIQGECRSQPAAAVMAEIATARLVDWPWHLPQSTDWPAGWIEVQASWLARSVWALISCTESRTGSLRYQVGSFRPIGQGPYGPAWRRQPTTHFQIVMNWTSPSSEGFIAKAESGQSLRLKTLQAMLVRANVGLDYRLRAPEKGEHQITLYTPWRASDDPGGTSP